MRRVGVPFRDGDVPDDFLPEIGIVFHLVPSLAEEDLNHQLLLVMQHPEQRCVVLDGVGAEYGEPMGHDVEAMTCSTADRK